MEKLKISYEFINAKDAKEMEHFLQELLVQKLLTQERRGGKP